MADVPRLDDLREWRSQLLSEWNDLDTAMQAEEDLYFQRFNVEPIDEEGKLVVKTGSAPSDANAAIDSLVPTEIQVEVKPARDRAKYRAQAEKLVKLGKALFHTWRTPKDPFRLIASDMAIRRVGVARILYDDTLWPHTPADWESMAKEAKDDWEVLNRRHCPVVFERRNPRYTRWREIETGRDAGKVIVLVEHYLTTVLEAKIAFAGYDNLEKVVKNRRDNDHIWVDDIWYDKYRALLLEEEPLFNIALDGRQTKGVAPHPYPEIPYMIAPFRELGFEDVAEKYRGMLSDAAELYPMESQVLTMHIGILAWNAWRPYIGYTTDGRDVVMRPGRMTPIRRHMNEFLELLQGQPVPPELLQTAQVVDSYIQRNGVAQGPRTQEGTRSAQQVWAIQSIRQLKVEAAKQSLTGMAVRSLYLAARILEQVVDETITLPVPGKDRDGKWLGEVTINPAKDINRYWDGFDVTFGKRLDPAVLEQSKALMNLALNNWMPIKESWRLSGLTDSPQEWEDELTRQGVDRLPPMAQLAGLILTGEEYGEESWQFQTLNKLIMSQQRGGGQSQIGPGAAGGGTMQPPAGPTGSSAAGGGGQMPVNGAAARISGNTNGSAPRGVPTGSAPGEGG